MASYFLQEHPSSSGRLRRPLSLVLPTSTPEPVLSAVDSQGSLSPSVPPWLAAHFAGSPGTLSLLRQSSLTPPPSRSSSSPTSEPGLWDRFSRPGRAERETSLAGLSIELPYTVHTASQPLALEGSLHPWDQGPNLRLCPAAYARKGDFLGHTFGPLQCSFEYLRNGSLKME